MYRLYNEVEVSMGYTLPTDYVAWHVYNPLLDFEAKPVGHGTVLFDLYSIDLRAMV